MLYVSPRKVRRLLARGDLAEASNQRKSCPLTGWKRVHNRGKCCPNSELALCHRPKTAALRPAIIASHLSRTNSRRARPAIPPPNAPKPGCTAYFLGRPFG